MIIRYNVLYSGTNLFYKNNKQPLHDVMLLHKAMFTLSDFEYR
jgi:hypothetical protein